MARILVIEDERDLQQVVAYNLRQAGHEVATASGGQEGLRLAREQPPDLVLLDLMLPDIPGTEVCRALKREPATQSAAVVMVTAKGEEIDRVVGFELGADDYVVKPFSVRELILRVRAILRRAEGTGEAEERFTFGKLEVDRAAHRAWVTGEEVAFTALELRLLVMLYDRRGRVLTRDLLLDEVWGSHVDVTARNVDTHVKRVREKLGAAGEYIETVRGVGYRFRAEPLDEAATPKP